MMNPTHQHTLNGMVGASTFFAVAGAAIGDQVQQYGGAITSIIIFAVMLILQLKQRVDESQVRSLEIKLRKAQLAKQIERVNSGEIVPIDAVPATPPAAS